MGNDRQRNIRVLLGLPRHEREASYADTDDVEVYRPEVAPEEDAAAVEKRAVVHWRLAGAIIMVLATIGLVRSLVDLSRIHHAREELADVPPCR